MNIKNEHVEIFLYEGNDEMIDLGKDRLPKTSRDFVAQLKLKNGKIVDAPSEWRDKIWNWWYTARKVEIQDSVLIQAAHSMVGKPSSYRK